MTGGLDQPLISAASICAFCVLMSHISTQTTVDAFQHSRLAHSGDKFYGRQSFPYVQQTPAKLFRLISSRPPPRFQDCIPCPQPFHVLGAHAPSDLAVSLDRPVLARPSGISYSRSMKSAWKTAIPVLVSDVFKTVAVAFALALFLSLVAKSSMSLSPSSILPAVENVFKLARGKVTKLLDKVKAKIEAKYPGVVMPFDGEDGWGKCTLRSKRPVGDSTYVQYDFDLEREDYTLPLQLGQKLSLCCLDEDDDVVTGHFFVFSPRSSHGYFSIVAPRGAHEEVEYAVGKENANFIRVLEHELTTGDEVAIKPGESSLDYQGQFLPVTDMVYLSFGCGIVPILDQVKSVLPSKSSTVKSLSVIWVNEDPGAFDLAYSDLEREFYKYNTKLDVCCCVEDVRSESLEDFEDIEQSVPDFIPGTMAVISGPRVFAVKAQSYLLSRGYPADCVCVL